MSGGGAGIKIDVDKQGDPWLIKSDNTIYSFTSAGWIKNLFGLGKDIGLGLDGSIWVIGLDDKPWRFSPSTNSWVAQGDIVITAIDIDNQGIPYVVTTSNDIFRRVGSSWAQVAGGRSYDVGATGGVTVGNFYSFIWAIGLQNRIALLNEQTAAAGGIPGASGWRFVNAPPSLATPVASRISVAANGRPYVIDPEGFVWRRNME